MISKNILLFYLSLSIPLVSSYTIRQQQSSTCAKCRRHANTLPSPLFHKYRPTIYRQKRAFISLMDMTASSSETQTNQDIPTIFDATTTTTTTTNSTSTSEDIHPTRKMRVSELKKALEEWNVKYDDCFDQESLLVRYNEAIVQKQQQEQQEKHKSDDTTTTTTTTAAATPNSSPSINDTPKNIEQQQKQHEEMLQGIRQMSVKELREELGQRRVSRVGLFEKTDLIQAVYDARMAAQSFSVTGLLQPYLVTEVTGDQLQQEIQNDSNMVTTPLLVDVYATWCGPCQLMSKQLNDVANELGSTVRIVKLDSDKYTNVASQLRVQGLPTIILYNSNGTELNRIEGAMMKDPLIQWIQQQQQQQQK